MVDSWQAVRLVEHSLDAGQAILLGMLTVCGVHVILLLAGREPRKAVRLTGLPTQRVQPAPLSLEVWAQSDRADIQSASLN